MATWKSCEHKLYLSFYPRKREGWQGWSRAAPQSQPGLGVPALPKGPWSCWQCQEGFVTPSPVLSPAPSPNRSSSPRAG